jgi:hypothetical protein
VFYEKIESKNNLKKRHGCYDVIITSIGNLSHL